MMGMFDSIKEKLYCPFCGTLIENEFQTKEFAKCLATISVEEIDRPCTIYSECQKCKNWVELYINPIFRKPIIAKSNEGDELC